MKLKKCLSLALAGAVSLSLLAGCQNNTPAGGSSSASENPLQTVAQLPDGGSGAVVSNPAPAEPSNSEGGKTLVAYYSATGSTQAVAQTIAGTTGGDLFEIVPAEPYTSADLDWTDDTSRVSKEHDDPSLRDVVLTADRVDNWDDYDTVFIGYPNWWGTLPQAVMTFLEEYDFSGKTIIPFCSHGGSRLGGGPRDIAALCPDATLLDGLAVGGSDVSGAQRDVQDWLAGLNY